MSDKPKIAVTLGDPCGISPEIVAKVVSSEETRRICEPVVFGGEEIFSKACELVSARKNGIEVVDCEGPSFDDLHPGEIDSEAGRQSLLAIEKAVEYANSGRVDAVVTAPINKKAIQLAGSPYPGHTEMLRDLTGAENAVMMFESGDFRVALVTVHCALKDVPSLVTEDSVFNTVSVCASALEDRFGIESPKFVVCGLNPHAGENGEFGSEEIEHIAPAVVRASAAGVDISGPLPADSVFYGAVEGRWDAVIAMYHDQGLAPFKMLSFYRGVNITLGLPIVRTSPDHGTAFDIAWSGVADPRSMQEAVKTAVRLVR
ncbi:MAG: 4-hydroxythreonine-4-phosphate dehydrogenase PdxA [Candidatus Mycalebacterium zealandia]|nr:MAG: 4-hydroxythreonine-4-phosphate dehydrogenase PdxA [Candidatus Mycalebacterium zealandia]